MTENGTGWWKHHYPRVMGFCSRSNPPAWFYVMVGVGAMADFSMQGCTKPCLCDTAALQVISFCASQSASLRHPYLYDLSVALSFISKHVTQYSDSQFHAFFHNFAACFFHLLFFLVLVRPELILLSILGLFLCFCFHFFHG